MRNNLYSLDTYITTVNSGIDKSNEYAMINYESLTARGERCNDMVSNLFKGYLAEGYKQFMRYIQHQKDKCDDGNNIDKYNLMVLALNKY